MEAKFKDEYVPAANVNAKIKKIYKDYNILSMNITPVSNDISKIGYKLIYVYTEKEKLPATKKTTK